MIATAPVASPTKAGIQMFAHQAKVSCTSKY